MRRTASSILQRPVPRIIALTLMLCCPALAENAAEIIPVKGRELQQVIDAAPPNAVIMCDRNETLTLSAPITIRKPLTLAGLSARLPDKLGKTSLVLVETSGVSVIDFVLTGNGESVPQKDRAPLLIIHAGDFRVERGQFINSSKDGVMIEGENQDLVGGVVRDIVGRDVIRDTVSISGSAGQGHRIRNVLVDNVRCYGSRLRGAVEVSDGTDNITVRKVYAESSIYAVDVQDHNQPGQSNQNVLIQDVFALRCKHALRTANSRKGHANLTVRDITAQECQEPVRISHTANVQLDNVRVLNHQNNKPPVHLKDCHGISIRDLVVAEAVAKTPALLLENCNDAQVDGVYLRGRTNQLTMGVCYRITSKDNFSGLHISNVSARQATGPGIVLEAVGNQNGTLTDYLISGNLTAVMDGIRGQRGIIGNNWP